METTKYEKVVEYAKYLDYDDVYSEHRFQVVECGRDWCDALIWVVDCMRLEGRRGLPVWVEGEAEPVLPEKPAGW